MISPHNKTISSLIMSYLKHRKLKQKAKIPNQNWSNEEKKSQNLKKYTVHVKFLQIWNIWIWSVFFLRNEQNITNVRKYLLILIKC